MHTAQSSSQTILQPARSSAPNTERSAASPFRRSIWKKSNQYHFGIYTQKERDGIAQVYDVVSAKVNIPFPTPKVCNELPSAIAVLPNEPASVPSDRLVATMTQYLQATRDMRGIGVAIAICLLAVVKEGRYAPVDRKTANGLANLGVTTEVESRFLTRAHIRDFVHVCTTRVLPAWFEDAEQRIPEDAYAYWGSHAKSGHSD